MAHGHRLPLDFSVEIVHVSREEDPRSDDLDGAWRAARGMPLADGGGRMRIVIAAVGRAREPAYRDLLDAYYGRTRRWAELVETEIKEERDDKVALALERVIASQGARAEVVALEVTGERLSSEQFARRVDDAMQRAVVPVFVLGGADGNVPMVRARARWQLSLGAMTLPHRLARLVLAEQIYRAFTILRGEPYAR